MSKAAEDLKLRMQVDGDLLDLVTHEIVDMRWHLVTNKTPFSPVRRHELFEALRLLQGVAPR